MMHRDLLDYVNLGIYAFFPLLELVGAIVCLMFRRLSPYLVLAMIGFLGVSAVSLFRLVAVEVNNELQLLTSHQAYSLFFIICNVLGVGFFLLVIVGLALAFSDGLKGMRRLRELAEEAGEKPFIPETRSDWRAAQQGSQDIQQ
jgi:hypothetical protein